LFEHLNFGNKYKKIKIKYHLVIMGLQKGGVFTRNRSRGFDLRVFVDLDPQGMTAFFEEYLAKEVGYIPRRSDYYYLPEAGVDRLIPEFMHITQVINRPDQVHSTLEINPFNFTLSTFMDAGFSQRDISKYNPRIVGKLRCEVKQDRRGIERTHYSFNNRTLSMSKAINLLEAWCNKGANREKSLVRDFFSNYTLDSSYEFAEKILLLMKYAVLIFKAEKKVINRMELQTKRRDTQGYRQSESDLLTDVQRFKSDWYENAYTTSKRNLESLKGHNPPLTATDIQEIRTRWRDSEFPIPYGTERIQFRRRLHL
jgi:hypothetical protein